MELPSIETSGKAEPRLCCPLTVVIADDSPVVRGRLRDMLVELPGVEIVGEAEDAGGALDAVQEVQPDLLTLDITMRCGNGLMLLQVLEKMEQAPLVVVVTNRATPENRRLCKDLGVLHVFDKACQEDELVLLVESLQRGPNAVGGLA